MAEHRQERLNELIKVEVGQMLQRNLKDPRIGFVSVTDVEVSNDYSHVKIFISCLGSEAEKAASMSGLESAKGYIRSELGQRIKLRRTPEIHFLWDDSLERGSRIMELLNEVKKEQGSDS